MKVLKSYEWKANAARQTYPWSELLDGQCRQLEPDDFGPEGMPKGFPALVRKKAKAMGLMVKVEKTGDGGGVIQAFKPDAGGEAAGATAGGGEGKAPTGKAKGGKK